MGGRPGRDIPARARHIVEAIRLVRDFVDGVDEAMFLADLKTQSAVEQLDLEASAEITDRRQLQRRFPEVPWASI